MPRASKTLDAVKKGAKTVAAAAGKGAPGKGSRVKAKKATEKAVPARKAPAAKKTRASAARATKDQGLDKFLHDQRAALQAERATYESQAQALKDEADQMAQEAEPGDIQFDDESGEGGTINIDRERDLALSAQARAAVEEIDHALAKIAGGTYGVCEACGQAIPKARLKALPQARLCVSCKSGGLSRR